MTPTVPRVRIAPSPTGDPHVGTAYVALFNSSFARANGGKFVLRIDDTDRQRYQSDSEQQIFRALKWLGIEWDEGPDIGGPFAPYRQSERTEIYHRAAHELVARDAAYYCFCTPERLEKLRAVREHDKGAPGYDRACRALNAEQIASQLATARPYVIRLKVPLTGATRFRDELRGEIVIENREIDDQVLFKSDGFPTYHLANCVDDSAMGITHVVRAEEWITSTPKHVILYDAIGGRRPLFFHVPLLRNADHSKISKRKNPVSLNFYRSEGYLPEALLNFLANMGWSSPDQREIFDREHFVRNFRLEDIRLGGPVFDLEKLRWMNGEYIRSLPLGELGQRLRTEGFAGDLSDTELATLLPLAIKRMHLLSEFRSVIAWFREPPLELTAVTLVPQKMTATRVLEVLDRTLQHLPQLTDWSVAALESALETCTKFWQVKKPELYMPLRLALTGRSDTPPVPDLLATLGAVESAARIRRARAALAGSDAA
ncbi:MAG: glutamate--tRNA ligase [Planctomycetota bacterium]